MKLKKLVAAGLTVVMLCSLVVLVGCGSQDLSDHELVGEWAWDEAADFLYIFNEDGTGERGFSGLRETFTWSIPGDGRVRIRRDVAERGYIRNEQWDYTLVGDVFTISSRQVADMTFSYIRVDETAADVPDGEIQLNYELIGTWAWDDNYTYTYVFNADRTGVRGFAGATETFTWSNPGDGRITIRPDELPTGGIQYEQWDYTLIDNIFTISSRQVTGMTFSYTRVD